jgi:hypothetical protein
VGVVKVHMVRFYDRDVSKTNQLFNKMIERQMNKGFLVSPYAELCQHKYSMEVKGIFKTLKKGSN